MVENNFQKILSVVQSVPEGKVATYGQIARIAGIPRNARQVGYALHGVSEGTDIPWHRIINTKGQISFPVDSSGYAIQRALLEAEGIRFSLQGRISIKKYQWKR
ncbi:MAG: MGMT family protein [Ignavibacteriales bacterium]|nr:MGMT family protein [Ignavibacteriales bacterium]